MADENHDVILYGATGYTGALIGWELAQRGFDFAIAGRDGTRLRGLAAELPWRPTVHEVDVDDADGLERLARRTKVLISAAGPYVELGPPVMDAAIRAGTHFLDITGEQSFLRWAWEQDPRVQDAGITVVNGMGFDVVPSDIAAHVACTAMRDVARVDLCIETNARLSGGTRRSMALTGGRGWWYDRGRYRPAPPGRFRRSFRFPEDVPPFHTGAAKEGSKNDAVGAGAMREGIFVPWGDCITAPRTTNASQVRTFFVTKPEVARRYHRAWPITAAAAGIPFIRARIQARMAKRARPSGAGPTEAEREAARFAILAEATGSDGNVQHGMTTGRDPYGLTAAAVVQGAQLLQRARIPTGVLTPTQAFTFGPFVDALSRFDLQWRARSLNG